MIWILAALFVVGGNGVALAGIFALSNRKVRRLAQASVLRRIERRCTCVK